MKSTLLLMILVFAVNYSIGQTTSPKQSWIGVSLSTDINYRKLSIEQPDSMNMISIRNGIEKYKISNSFALCYKRIYNERISFETGIQYANLGYRTDFNTLRFEDQIDPSTGFVKPTSEPIVYRPLGITRTFHYAEVPLRILYHHNDEPIHFYAGFGVIPGFLVGSITKICPITDGDSKQVIKENKNINLFNISPTVSAGLHYQINDNVHFGVETIFRYGLLSATTNQVNTRLYNGGLRFTSYWGI